MDETGPFQRAARRRAAAVRRVADASVPTVTGSFRCVAYEADDGVEHVAFVCGDVAAAGAAGNPVLVRLHSECLTGDVFGSLRCDCGPQLEAALRRVQAEGLGAVVYLRGHEGRGIGIGAKIRAYALQDDGLDTVDANVRLGLPVDDRDYAIAAAIVRDLGIGAVRLLTNNPAKHRALTSHGVAVAEQVPLQSSPTAQNLAYLRTKRDRMGHLLEGLG